jgi:VanZ family protein
VIRRALPWVPAVAWACAIFFMSAQPSVPAPQLPYIDKVMHFGAYGVLGLCLAFATHQSAVAPWIGALLGVLYGASDEIHQSFVGGRTPDVFDWVADAAGVLLATWLYTRYIRRRTRRAAPDGADRPPAPYIQA